MATFGVLKGLENPSQAACDCAQSMIETMEHIAHSSPSEGLPSLRPTSASPWVRSLGTLGGSVALVYRHRCGGRRASRLSRIRAPSGSIC